MVTRIWVGSALVSIAVMGFAFDAAAQRAGRGDGAAQPAARGRGQGAPATLPPLFFREAWKRPPYTGELNDENRRVTQDAVTNSNLELKLYGADAKNVL